MFRHLPDEFWDFGPACICPGCVKQTNVPLRFLIAALPQVSSGADRAGRRRTTNTHSLREEEKSADVKVFASRAGSCNIHHVSSSTEHPNNPRITPRMLSSGPPQYWLAERKPGTHSNTALAKEKQQKPLSFHCSYCVHTHDSPPTNARQGGLLRARHGGARVKDG